MNRVPVHSPVPRPRCSKRSRLTAQVSRVGSSIPVPKPVSTAPTVITGTAGRREDDQQTEADERRTRRAAAAGVCGADSRANASDPAAVASDMTALIPPIVAVEVTPTPVSTNDSSHDQRVEHDAAEQGHQAGREQLAPRHRLEVAVQRRRRRGGRGLPQQPGHREARAAARRCRARTGSASPRRPARRRRPGTPSRRARRRASAAPRYFDRRGPGPVVADQRRAAGHDRGLAQAEEDAAGDDRCRASRRYSGAVPNTA